MLRFILFRVFVAFNIGFGVLLNEIGDVQP